MASPSAGLAGSDVLKSYAQVVNKKTEHPTFKIPMRFPVDIDGEMGFVFSELEMTKAADEFRYALVMKFMKSRPSIDKIRLTVVKTWGLTEVPTISFMDEFHVLIHMKNERDFVHGWAREGRTMEGLPFRLFKWTKDFDVQKESPLAPQWIFLPGLPMHLYRIDFLQIIATRFGRYLGTDNATLNHTRASGARIFVEVDLTMEPVKGFPMVVSPANCIWQEAKYERTGFYCSKCFRQGHTSVVCRVGEKRKIEGKVKGKKIWQQKGIKEPMEDKTGTGMGEKILDTGVVNGNPNENMASASIAHDMGDLNVTSPIEMVPEKNLDEVVITSQPDLIKSVDMIQHREGKQVAETECGQHVQSAILRDSDNSDEECEEVWHDDEPELQQSAQADRMQTMVLDEEETNERTGNGSPQREVTTGYSSEREEGEITVLLGKEKLYDTDGERQSTAAKVSKSDAYEERSRRALWQELEGLLVTDQPWIVVGDFNTIRMDSERIGGNPRSLPSMNEFNDFIDRCGLFELTCSGQRLSWCNGHAGTSRSWARLDRVLINNNFLTRFQFTKVNYLSCKSSDHCPMVVSSEIPFTAYGPSPFRFMNMWCLHADFLNFVKEVWNRPDEVQGMMKLVTRLKRTKVALRGSNKTVFGRVEGNIRALEERMDILEEKLQLDFSEDLEDDFLATKIELDLWEKREASRLGQLAKKKWLNEGDKYPAFFSRRY
ncbi:uncharacterized protein LOC122294521 [Carya illinoinensis]|uniref:uncharacterized protein LOC122294521 n=1 Tax=Carya illinoinensis TaxID=32201 RepID=UPI001C72616C|nr:uncharacterized protein LOC122294521 [Carya illinoinensis]